MTNEDFYQRVCEWLASKPAYPNVKWNLTQVDEESSEVSLTCDVELEQYHFAISGAMQCPNEEEAVEIAVNELYDGLPSHIEELLKQYAGK
ncbi:MAG: hypothetical protein IJT12_02935 [Paludibacteraceae bacterium]|nr:hypothetical protein [Paludibacteraceae bacterium]